MIVREARRPDAEAIAALERATFGRDAYPGVFIRQAIDLWPDLVCVADEGKAILGYAAAAPSRTAGEAWILVAAVRADARRRGIGSALMRALLDRLREADLFRVVLTVHPENYGAVRLYTELGFVVESEDPTHFGPGEPRLRMARESRPQR